MEAKKEPTQNIENILKERGSNYGNFAVVCEITELMKDAMKKGSNWDTLDDSAKVGLFFICNKIARCVNGKMTKDSLVDIQGYAKLIETQSKSVKE